MSGTSWTLSLEFAEDNNNNLYGNSNDLEQIWIYPVEGHPANKSIWTLFSPPFALPGDLALPGGLRADVPEPTDGSTPASSHTNEIHS